MRRFLLSGKKHITLNTYKQYGFKEKVMEYPQRWLEEHKAIKSPEGWRRPTTNELIKCQKGLGDDSGTKYKLRIVDYPKEIFINPSSLQGDYTLKYEIDLPNHVIKEVFAYISNDKYSVDGYADENYNVSGYVILRDENLTYVDVKLQYNEYESNTVRINLIKKSILKSIDLDDYSRFNNLNYLDKNGNYRFGATRSKEINFNYMVKDMDYEFNTPLVAKLVSDKDASMTYEFLEDTEYGSSGQIKANISNVTDGELLKVYLEGDGVKSNEYELKVSTLEPVTLKSVHIYDIPETLSMNGKDSQFLQMKFETDDVDWQIGRWTVSFEGGTGGGFTSNFDKDEKWFGITVMKYYIGDEVTIYLTLDGVKSNEFKIRIIE